MTEMTDEEMRREISNCNVYRIMDLINIFAMLYVVMNDNPCTRPFQQWIIANSSVAFFSLMYLTWWVNAQLAHQRKTSRAEAMTYFIEFVYIVCTCFAWRLFQDND